MRLFKHLLVFAGGAAFGLASLALLMEITKPTIPPIVLELTFEDFCYPGDDCTNQKNVPFRLERDQSGDVHFEHLTLPFHRPQWEVTTSYLNGSHVYFGRNLTPNRRVFYHPFVLTISDDCRAALYLFVSTLDGGVDLPKTYLGECVEERSDNV